MRRAILFSLVWACSAYGALQLSRLELGHTICGPWGCGPPSSALLAVHAFWLVTLMLVGLSVRQMQPHWDWRRIGLCVAVGAAVAVVAIGIWDFFTWRSNPWDPEGMYVWQRFLFRLATLSDVPLIQVGLMGLLLAFLGRRPAFLDRVPAQSS